MAQSSSSGFSIAVDPAGAGPVQDVIFAHSHGTEALGTLVDGVPGLFTVSRDTNSHEFDVPPRARWDIVNDNPIYAGENYFQVYMEQIDGEIRRVERSGSGAHTQIEMLSAGNSEWYAPEKYWFGWVMRIDRMDMWGVKSPLAPYNDPEGFRGGGVLQQFHMRNWNPPVDRNPPVSVVHQLGGLYLRIEGARDGGNGDQFVFTGLDESIAGTAAGNYNDGETHAFIWEVLWDSRLNADGSTGYVRVYIDDNPSPAAEWGSPSSPKSNLYPMPHLDLQTPPRTPYLKYGGYRGAFTDYTVSLPNGTAQEISYGNVVMHGSGANREGVLESLNWANVV